MAMQVGRAEPLTVVNRRPKITVVGAGNVGATAAQYIVEKELGARGGVPSSEECLIQ